MPSATHESCLIPVNDSVFQHYHDHEWGVPTHTDQTFFEKVCLEGFQSGLSWRTILHRRPALREAFDGFIPERVARYSDADVARLMSDKRIVRNRQKIRSVINNANRFLELKEEYGSVAAFFWRFEPPPDQRPQIVNRRWLASNPMTPESAALSKALKQLGWSYIGPTNMYALMQALGIVNDHVQGCPCRATVETLRQTFIRPVTTHDATVP